MTRLRTSIIATVVRTNATGTAVMTRLRTSIIATAVRTNATGTAVMTRPGARGGLARHKDARIARIGVGEAPNNAPTYSTPAAASAPFLALLQRRYL